MKYSNKNFDLKSRSTYQSPRKNTDKDIEKQFSKPTFPHLLSQGAGFLEDNFFKGRWFWDDWRIFHLLCTLFLLLLHWDMWWNNYTDHHNAESVGALSLFSWNETVPSLADGRAMGSSCKYRGSLTHWLIAHLLLCGLVPNRPRAEGPVLVYSQGVGGPCSKPNTWDIL